MPYQETFKCTVKRREVKNEAIECIQYWEHDSNFLKKKPKQKTENKHPVTIINL